MTPDERSLDSDTLNIGQHKIVLRKCGVVLILFGLLGYSFRSIEFYFDFIANPSLEVRLPRFAEPFLLVAGAFLWRGSLGTAYFARWMSAFFLTLGLGISVYAATLFPPGLLVLLAKNYPYETLAEIGERFTLFPLLYWLQKRLSSPSVVNASRRSGRTIDNMKVPIVLAFLCIFGIATFFFTFRSERKNAVQLASQQLGESYNYSCMRFAVISNDKGTGYEGLVAAWKEDDLKFIDVGWAK